MQLSEITAAVHTVVGPHSRPICRSDVEGFGLDAADSRQAADIAQAGARLLHEVGKPRLLTGDLWTVNTLLTPAPVPAICGVLNLDRT
ncbi:hypothetical protein [Streptomyces sp. Wb2n-11]|uniref:hypothetical protein n=1 Tax=Streptomyces sp. Wb2n-11 TaxID=1030533 RepID=UPI000AC5581D|nr:hypothetical protein [Streptomyces sp. Wb2n-11]